MADASKDANDVSTLLGVSNADNSTPVKIWASPSTHRLLVDSSGGGGTPGGSDTDIQFNDAGSFGGEDTFTFDKTTNVVTLGVEDSTAVFKGADATTASTPGGTVELRGGTGSTNDVGGESRLLGGQGGPTGSGSNAEVVGGDAGGGNGNGGNALLQGGAKSGAGTDGKVQLLDASSGESAFLLTTSLSADRNFTFPDASGTFQLSGGSGTGQFSDGETPSGTVNGSNVTFTLAHTPSPAASLQLFVNGQLQAPAGVDFTLVTATITFVSAPLTGSVLLAWYRY